MQAQEELLQIADNLTTYTTNVIESQLTDPIKILTDAINKIDKSFCGSWWGYHSNVFYNNFAPPPPGAHFSQEWGLKRSYSGLGTKGDWVEYDHNKVREEIFKISGNPDLKSIEKLSKESRELFTDKLSDVLSILTYEISLNNDAFLIEINKDIQKLELLTPDQILNRLKPSNPIMTNDTIVVGQGPIAPAHQRLLAELIYLNNSIGAVGELGKLAKKAGAHIARKNMTKQNLKIMGNKIFIGHGNSPVWKDLKDFIQNRLKLPYDEFNRVPVAGISTVARLEEMVNEAVFAFIIFTGEDEQPDGSLHARMNAIHEAGLFQGKLGFKKAIILMEDGCKEFSNIYGLSQIKFSKDNISAIFENIREVLEREGIY